MPSISTSNSSNPIAESLTSPPESIDIRPASRPEHITALIDGVERYNPDSLGPLEAYLAQQCENGTFDCLADLSILKLYQFNPDQAKEDLTTNILVKALTHYPHYPSFSLCLHLLPPHVLISPPLDTLSESIQKLRILSELLDSAQYEAFWDEYDNNDIYLDLTADVMGFEDSVRKGIARSVSMVVTGLKRKVLEGWVNLKGDGFEKWLTEQTGWTLDGDVVRIPGNGMNVAGTGAVRGENLKFDVVRERLLKNPQF